MKKSFNTNPVKRLLIPTDFSKDAENAIRFGVQLGRSLKSKITLYHAVHVPVLTTAEMALATPMHDEKEASYARLNLIKNELEKEFDYPEIDVLVSTGFAVDEITKLSQDEKFDLVVMGTRGASGVAELLIGSNTADVIEKCTCPVFAIPSNARFSQSKKILFATNYADNDFQTLYLLAEMFKSFNPEIVVLHVEAGGDHKMENRTLEWFKGQVITNIPYNNFSFQTVLAGNVESAVHDFIVEHHVDMLSVSTRKRNFFDTLTSRSLSKKLAYHTEIPLLVFHAHSSSGTPLF
ncbi:MAG: universal stress protein [Bacteroidia bacterium]|nr:universal stress protein [Bacteroidia bacterium]